MNKMLKIDNYLYGKLYVFKYSSNILNLYLLALVDLYQHGEIVYFTIRSGWTYLGHNYDNVVIRVSN